MSVSARSAANNTAEFGMAGRADAHHTDAPPLAPGHGDVKLRSPRAEQIAALVDARKANHTLPARLYNSADALDVDLDVIFHRHWISVGVVSDVPEAGDVYAVDIGTTPIVIVRGEDDEIRAFHNVCRHRAARLVPQGRHIVGKLVCPYHQWAYELTGELFQAPHMGFDLDKSLLHLKPVHLRSVAGLLYVCLADQPPADIEDYAADVAPRLAPYELANTRIAFETDLIEDGNWKLVMENNRECYHCEGGHPELALSFRAADFGFDPDELSPHEREEVACDAASYAEQRAEWQRMGLDHRAIDKMTGGATHYRAERLMIGGAGESQTPDTRYACNVRLGRMTMERSGDLHLWGNNSWHHFMADHAVIFAVYPIGPDKTLVRTKWLVHADAVEGVDYDVEALTSVWRATNQQDADLVALAQEGVKSAGYVPGPYSSFTEKPLDDYLTWYCERLAAHNYGG